MKILNNNNNNSNNKSMLIENSKTGLRVNYIGEIFSIKSTSYSYHTEHVCIKNFSIRFLIEYRGPSTMEEQPHILWSWGLPKPQGGGAKLRPPFESNSRLGACWCPCSKESLRFRAPKGNLTYPTTLIPKEPSEQSTRHP